MGDVIMNLGASFRKLLYTLYGFSAIVMLLMTTSDGPLPNIRTGGMVNNNPSSYVTLPVMQ